VSRWFGRQPFGAGLGRGRREGEDVGVGDGPPSSRLAASGRAVRWRMEAPMLTVDPDQGVVDRLLARRGPDLSTMPGRPGSSAWLEPTPYAAGRTRPSRTRP
jgi:hypothetical protein